MASSSLKLCAVRVWSDAVAAAFRRCSDILRDDRGAAAVSFILTFPIFLTIVSVVVQFALLVNAKIVVEHAAHLAGRSAATALPDQHPEKIDRAARLALAPLSPATEGSTDPEGTAVVQALRDCSVRVSENFASRYTYAMDAAHTSWTSSGDDFLHARGQEMEVTLKYQFCLTVPLANAFIAPRTGRVGGVTGRFFELSSTCRVRTSDGRQVRATTDGSPK